MFDEIIGIKRLLRLEYTIDEMEQFAHDSDGDGVGTMTLGFHARDQVLDQGIVAFGTAGGHEQGGALARFVRLPTPGPFSGVGFLWFVHEQPSDT